MSDRHMHEEDFEERVRTWLHAEATTGTVPAPLRDHVNAIPATTPYRRWAWPRLQSLAPVPALAATVVIAAALTAVGLWLVQPFLATAPEDEVATQEELDAAITSAVEALAESPGVEGVQLAYIGEHLSGAVWFDSRPNGEVAVVQRVDMDVAQSGWWLNPEEGPPATGRNIATTAWILVDDYFYEATWTGDPPDDGWSVDDRDAAPRGPLAFGLLVLAGEDRMFDLPSDDGEVTHAETGDGGSVWTLTAPYREGSGVQTWEILPGGELGSWSWELVGVSLPMDVDTDPVTSGRIDFTPLTDPDPINAPDAEVDVNLVELGLPEDFPLGSD